MTNVITTNADLTISFDISRHGYIISSILNTVISGHTTSTSTLVHDNIPIRTSSDPQLLSLDNVAMIVLISGVQLISFFLRLL